WRRISVRRRGHVWREMTTQRHVRDFDFRVQAGQRANARGIAIDQPTLHVLQHDQHGRRVLRRAADFTQRALNVVVAAAALPSVVRQADAVGQIAYRGLHLLRLDAGLAQDARILSGIEQLWVPVYAEPGGELAGMPADGIA